jgi:hypothetical protein
MTFRPSSAQNRGPEIAHDARSHTAVGPTLRPHRSEVGP